MTRNEQRRFGRLHEQRLRALKRHGKAKKPVDAYARGVRRLAAFVDHCPDNLSVIELSAYFDQLSDAHGWSTVKIDHYAMRFFYEHILGETIPWLEMVVPPKSKSLPDGLTIEEIARLITVTREQRYRVFWLAPYSMGLRLGGTLTPEVGDIDRERMRGHVSLAKGHKDRFVVLPALILRALRALALWCTHHHPALLFPGRPRRGRDHRAHGSRQHPARLSPRRRHDPTKRGRLNRRIHVWLHTPAQTR